MTHPSLMVIYGRWIGKRFYIIANCLLIVQTPFLPAAVDTTGRLYDDFSRLLFLHAHREASTLDYEIPEESGQFRFLRAARYVNIKRSVRLILAKASNMRISIPLDLSSCPFIPLSLFICRTHEGFSYLLVVPVFLTPYSCSVTFFLPFAFFNQLKIGKRPIETITS
jgi:hypothetical protein